MAVVWCHLINNIFYPIFAFFFFSRSKAGKFIYQSTSSRRGETAKHVISWKATGRGASSQPSKNQMPRGKSDPPLIILLKLTASYERSRSFPATWKWLDTPHHTTTFALSSRIYAASNLDGFTYMTHLFSFFHRTKKKTTKQKSIRFPYLPPLFINFFKKNNKLINGIILNM